MSVGPERRAVEPEGRLVELGLTLPAVVAPVAAYVPTVRTGDLVYVSGQVPSVDGEIPVTGKVGATVSQEQAASLAQICALNALAALKAEIGELARVRRVVKLLGFVASAPEFTGQAAVVNGASELLTAVFGPTGAHARSAVGVASLPLDAPVEVELIVEVE